MNEVNKLRCDNVFEGGGHLRSIHSTLGSIWEHGSGFLLFPEQAASTKIEKNVGRVLLLSCT